MKLHPLMAVGLLLWHIVRLLWSGVRGLVSEALTFCVKTVPRLHREAKLTKEMDFKLAARLRREH